MSNELNREKVLVIVAHPDDEVLGMGGTIAKLASKNIEVGLLIVTDGSTAQYRDDPELDKIIAKKKAETTKCAEILGIKKVFFGNLPDMKLDVTPHIEINRVIESTIDAFQPTTIFTHFYGDVNMDHQRVYESTLVACRPDCGQCVKKILLYSVPSSTNWNVQTPISTFIPNWYEDISGIFAEKKYSALKCYETELREYPHPRSVEYLRNSDIAEGNKVGLLSAESFIMVRNIE